MDNLILALSLSSPWAHLHVVGILWFMSKPQTNRACPFLFILFLCLFLSYDPFNCIPFHKFSRQFSVFSLCSSGLISALLVLSTLCVYESLLQPFPQWGAADAEIKAPSGENTELNRSPFKAWSSSAYSHACYAYCQGFLPSLLHFRSIHLHFFQNLSRFLLCWLWLTHGSCVGPQNEIGHPAGCRFPC